MSYLHGQQESLMLSTISPPYQFSATSTGIKARYACMQYPVKVRGVAVGYTTTIATGAANPVVSFRTGTTLGGGTLATIVNLTLFSGTGAILAGRVYYRRTQDTIVNPGQHVELNVTTAATIAGLRLRASLLIEPVAEQPANLGNMYLAS